MLACAGSSVCGNEQVPNIPPTQKKLPFMVFSGKKDVSMM
jgi:hypothetical protein